MNRTVNEMLIDLSNEYGAHWWSILQQHYGKRIGKMPEWKLNGRLTRTIARAWLTHDMIDVSVSINAAYPIAFTKVIIPHELAHFVAYRLFNDRGHQKPWKDVMRSIGVIETATVDVRLIK